MNAFNHFYVPANTPYQSNYHMMLLTASLGDFRNCPGRPAGRVYAANSRSALKTSVGV